MRPVWIYFIAFLAAVIALNLLLGCVGLGGMHSSWCG